jgi:hypothetical protein
MESRWLGENSIEVKLPDIPDIPEIRWYAAAPADHRYTYTGSGLPFANEAQALNEGQGGVVATDNFNCARIDFLWPNSYYKADMSDRIVPPSIYVRYTVKGEEKETCIRIGHRIPYRGLTYPESRKDAMFYADGWIMPVRTQEQVLRDSGYATSDSGYATSVNGVFSGNTTRRMPSNHWGLKPPL